MNRQGNTYTIIYTVVLVLIVGISLSLIYQVLRPRQEENMSDDTRRQILAAVLVAPAKGEKISDLYSKTVTESFFVDTKGNRTGGNGTPFDTDIAAESKKAASARLLPVFVAEVNSSKKYILPCYGAGLWGPIWGYVAFNADGNTIYGAYFAHQGETPGLGAEIEKPAFSRQFDGKSVFDDGHFTSVAVVKNGMEPESGSWVHAVSGGTITSQGVQKMLYSSLAPYQQFLLKLQNNEQ